ncbi:helix-turn-helix domain-containing protein [Phocaeicola sp.]
MKILHTTDEDPFLAGTDNMSWLHNHIVKLEDAAIFFCRQGHAHIGIDLLEYELHPNTQVVLLPGAIIHMSNVSEDFQASHIGFSKSIFAEITTRLDPSFFRFLKENPCITLPAERIAHIKGLSSSIEDLFNDRDNAFRLLMARNFIQNFLLDVYDKTQRLFIQSRPEGISRQEELFKRFIQLVHKHCTNQREVSFYATELFITPRYLSTVVQNVTSTTAKSIIDKHVVLEIKALLKSTDLSIQEISNKLSFPDQSFFGRYFKKHTGMSPMQYRSTP